MMDMAVYCKITLKTCGSSLYFQLLGWCFITVINFVNLALFSGRYQISRTR